MATPVLRWVTTLAQEREDRELTADTRQDKEEE
jgi:hypothetical protein